MALISKSVALALLGAVLPLSFLHGQQSGLPDAKDPVAGMGVNIHFTDAQPGELEMISKAGFRWIRMDLHWQATEKSAGVYDFSAYDRLLANLDKFHIRALLILDYGNPLYDKGLPPSTDEGRAAFARWAVAAVTHFKNRGALWEIWNEPNIQNFWQPKVDSKAYAWLASLSSQAIKKAAPDELIVGPALSGTNLSFLDLLGEDGVFEYWSALTIHPYRHAGPESYGPTYDAARELIAKYITPGQRMEIICGESGYCCTWPGLDETLQAKYLPRLFLFDILSGIPVTIWYDWRDDGNDPADQEHHFGIVHHDYVSGAANVYEPKPAYESAKTYSTALSGLAFKDRLKTASKDDYVLRFTNGSSICIAAWTASPAQHKVQIHLPDGIYVSTSYDGKTQTEIASTNGLMILPIDGGPQYLKRQ